MNPRFFCTELSSAGTRLLLPDTVRRHAVSVLRLRAGSEVTLFDGTGIEADAVLAHEGDKLWYADIVHRQAVSREVEIPLTLVQALVSAEKMDWIIQKATELGAQAVQPLLTRRSLALPGGERAEKKQLHWQQVAIAACEQCGRNQLPQILPPLPLMTYLAQARQAAKWLLMPQRGRRLSELSAPDAGLLHLLVGPEGGWDDDEAAQCLAQPGSVAIRLGARVLRTETAGLAALAGILARWGDF